MKYCVAANMAGSPTTPVPLSGDFCEQMRKAHEMGYDAIEIHVPDVSVLDIPAIQACMQETGMEVATLGTGTIYGRYGLHLCDADEQRQQELFERVCAFIDCAAQLNARVTIGSIKGNIRPDEDREKHLDILGNWGLVAGKYQTFEPWTGMWENYDKDPEHCGWDFEKWFHDLYRPSLRPYNPKEIALMKKVCKLADSDFMQLMR